MSFRSKVVVRNFPPSLTEDRFQKFLEPWDAWINYASLHPGKVPHSFSAKPAKGARACINFTEASKLLQFAQHCGENPFLDDQGQSHQLSVEFAPYQVIPAPPIRLNSACGTLDSDEDFKLFLQSISGEGKDGEKVEPALPLDEQIEKMIALERELNPWKYDKKLVRSTALLEHLKGLKKTKAATAATKGKESAIPAQSDDIDDKGKAKKKKQKKKSKSKEPLNAAPPAVAPPGKAEETPAPSTTAPPTTAATGKKKKGKGRAGKDGKPDAQAESTSSIGPFKILKKPNPISTDEGKVQTLDGNSNSANLAELPERRPLGMKPNDLSLNSSEQSQPNAHSESVSLKATLGASVARSGTTDTLPDQGRARKSVFRKKDLSDSAGLLSNQTPAAGSSPAPITPLPPSVIRFSSKPQGSGPVKKPTAKPSVALAVKKSESPPNLE